MFPGTPTRPKFLDKLATKEWKRIIAALADLDLLRATDTGVLASYCVAYSRWQKAEEILASEGPVKEIVGSTGQMKYIKHPMLMVSSEAQKQMLRAGSLLGFSPSDRSKVSAPPKQVANPFASLDDDE